MNCGIATCPHRLAAFPGCPFVPPGLPARNVAAGLALQPASLVVGSLEIGRMLADRGKATFRAQGVCMFPCVQPGDVLHIESRTIGQVQVGDIAVYRRNTCLFGHRVIAKRTDSAKPGIMTRPDRTKQGDDGPTYGDDVLGVVTAIERRGVPMPLHPQSLRGGAALSAAVREWWNGKGQPRLIERIGVLQGRAWYRRLASGWWVIARPRLSYVVRVPLNARLHDISRELAPDAFDVSQPLWHGRPVTRWTLAVRKHPERQHAATATLALHPAGCPRGEGWWVEEVRSRLRYRHTGLEDALLGEALAILVRNGLAWRRS